MGAQHSPNADIAGVVAPPGTRYRVLTRVAAAVTVHVLGSGLALLVPQYCPRGRAHNSGQSMTGAFEGMVSQPDAAQPLIALLQSHSENRLELPVGPTTRIEPGGETPDQGQPTIPPPPPPHPPPFPLGGKWGVFTTKREKILESRRNYLDTHWMNGQRYRTSPAV